METLLISIDEKEKHNPKILADKILKAAKDLNDAKGDLEKLKGKGFFDRAFSNNTKEIAELLIKQNDTMGTFLYIVQGIIMLNVNNILVLKQLHEELAQQEKARGESNTEYRKMAINFVKSSFASAENINNKFQVTETQIESIKEELIAKFDLDRLQDEKINQLNERSELLQHVDNLQNNKISEIAEALIQKKEKIAELEDVIEKQHIVDITQSNKIIELESQLARKSQIDEEQTLLLKTLFHKSDINLSNDDLKHVLHIKEIPTLTAKVQALDERLNNLNKNIKHLKNINLVCLLSITALIFYTIVSLFI